MTAGELVSLGSEAHEQAQLVQGLTNQATLLGIVAAADPEGQALIAAIHDRKHLTDALAKADDAYTAAVQDAVGGHGDWAYVREAGEVVRQARSALKQATK